MPDKQISALVVDDEPVAVKSLARILAGEGYAVKSTTKGEKAIEMIKAETFGIVLTDLLIDSVSGLDILAAVRERSPETEVIILTGHASVDTAIQATKQGAFHYLQKPIRPDEVRNIVRRAAEKLQLTARIQELESGKENDFPSIIGSSVKIVEIKKLIRRIKDSDSNVMITGESGTGKELVARAIHETSLRRKEKFIAFNCASFTDDLIANELFGHEKDAFTGATRSKTGLLETADKGTVFLDEVGDMPNAMQVKLLRVIQEREVMKVGGTESIPVDIRIVAATNKDLKKLCASGFFRQDLFFRLNVIPIHMPNLSERREDIPLLGSYFLRRCAEKVGKAINGFSDEAIGRLSSYGYPGNIRELENIVEHAVSMAEGSMIDVENLPKDIMEYDLYTFHTQEEKLKSLGEMEKEYIRWVLDQVKHNKTEAAKILNIDRASLYRKLKRYAFDDE
ncbi:MAG: sigma-54 dependent transcriptional regulator [Proteobacteria bacterium]|nr:sigma-54 dependent transcriptional regulator [Pseudomonadota bacterium]